MGRRTWLAGCTTFLTATFGAAALSPASAQPATTDAIVRVVDIGAGLCVVIAVPGGHGMLFDAGPPGADRCANAVRELVPGGQLDLMVLSHSDLDHFGVIRTLLDERPPLPRAGPALRPSEYQAAVIIHPGDPRGVMVDRMRRAFTYQRARGARVFDLKEIEDAPPPPRPQPTPIRPGDSFAVGAGRATFIAGWSNGDQTVGPGDRPFRQQAHRNNALSIVIRFEYGGHSVLLTGDTYGRTERDPDAVCGYAERIMVGRAATVPIDSDVMIGQHHGADNSTSRCFITAVSPEYVVFSAGNEYHHPRQATVDRLTGANVTPRPPYVVALANIFRTDLGDNEGGTEMTEGAGTCPDPTGDDDVEVRLPSSPTGRVSVAYTGASAGCGP